MFGVTFKSGTVSINTVSKYNMYLTSKTIEAPAPKTEYIDIPGADGSLDCTEAFGRVRYKDRKITMNFSAAAYGADFHTLYGLVSGDLLGRYFDGIIFDDNPDWQYSGRVTSIKPSYSKGITAFAIECTCSPFRKSGNYTAVSGSIDNWDFNDTGSQSVTVSCMNSGRPVHPVITADGACYVTAPFEENGGTVYRKVFIFDDAVSSIMLPEGTSTFVFEKVANSINVTFTSGGKKVTQTIFTTGSIDTGYKTGKLEVKFREVRI